MGIQDQPWDSVQWGFRTVGIPHSGNLRQWGFRTVGIQYSGDSIQLEFWVHTGEGQLFSLCVQNCEFFSFLGDQFQFTAAN